MGTRAARTLAASALCLVWLSGCGTSSRFGNDLAQTNDAQPEIAGEPLPGPPEPTAEPDETGTVGAHRGGAHQSRPGRDANDDLSLGRKYFRDANFALAEKHFRRAVDQDPRDIEGWVGLAATYDRLKRWDRADRAYAQAMRISGATTELLNNQGYSYMLRGEHARARATLLQAQALDPKNPYVKNNLELLDASDRKGKGTR